ncbi:hypothetical protein BC835DRAFT_1307603 [Cytidiella melzeri]|nr:hypothetical protein BC835DRAFT_1307603 [Cytidiella melzeri]
MVLTCINAVLAWRGYVVVTSSITLGHCERNERRVLVAQAPGQNGSAWQLLCHLYIVPPLLSELTSLQQCRALLCIYLVAVANITFLITYHQTLAKSGTENAIATNASLLCGTVDVDTGRLRQLSVAELILCQGDVATFMPAHGNSGLLRCMRMYTLYALQRKLDAHGYPPSALAFTRRFCPGTSAAVDYERKPPSLPLILRVQSCCKTWPVHRTRSVALNRSNKVNLRGGVDWVEPRRDPLNRQRLINESASLPF